MFGLLRRKAKPTPTCTCGGSLKGEPTEVTDEVYDGWMSAADNRELPVFKEIESILREHQRENPPKVWTIRRDITWLRKEAHKRGLDWGRA